jgi:transposase
MITPVIAAEHHPDTLEPQQMREALRALMDKLAERDGLIARQSKEALFKQALIDKLTHENAVLKRLKFGLKSEKLNAEQRSLLDETLDADLAAVSDEIAQALPDSPAAQQKRQAKRQALPAELPRQLFTHEPESTVCAAAGCGAQMKRIGDDVAEKLDYVPGVFSVHRHVRGKWACACCQTLVQVPVDPHVIDKGIPTPGLLAQVLVGKFADHLPLYRQEAIFGRSGVAIPRSTLAQWVGSCGVELQPLVDALKHDILSRSVVHADETPVRMLKPASLRDGKTHRAYLWAYAAGAHEDIKAMVYDFCESRAGANAKEFLSGWTGALVVDDFSGYKQLMGDGAGQITEVGCWAHARRKFCDLQLASQSQIAEQAVQQIAKIYAIEREVKDLSSQDRLRIRQERSRVVLDTLHAWLSLNRQKVPDGSVTAKAIDYSLRRWGALTRFLEDGQLPVDNNWIENQIRPIAIGRNNWLFAGSLRAGQRAAAVMSLIQSAKLNGLDPHAYLKDVLTRLPMHMNSRIDELLPHRWKPANA